jgi:YgiT-type zinc finger domain-containing protein
VKCMYCQGKMERGVAPFHIDRKGYHLQLDKIPAWVCSQCGEVYFGEEEVDSIQLVIRAVDEQLKKLAVPV